MPEYSLVPCKPCEYNELLDFLDEEFGFTEKHWFAKNKTAIFESTPESIANQYLIRDNGKIIAACGIYPIKLKIGKIILETGGFGSLAVDGSMRGKGIMSHILKQSISIMKLREYDVSWLGGDRFRYGNYGWVCDMGELVFTIRQRDLERSSEGIKIALLKKATIHDIPILHKIHGVHSICAMRDKKTWASLFKSKETEWYLSNTAYGTAYCVKSKWGEIIEIGGNSKSVSALLLGYLRKFKQDSVVVLYPDEVNAVSSMLYSVCATFSKKNTNGYLNILAPKSCWTKLLPVMAEGSPKLVNQLKGVSSMADKKILLERSLGFLGNLRPLPRSLKWAESLAHVPWWLGCVDRV